MIQYRNSMASLQPRGTDGTDNTIIEYLNICWRRRWLIVVLAIGAATVAATWSYLQTPIYQSKATVVIEQQGPGALERDKSYYYDVTPEYFQTHFELMKSHRVLQQTARLLDLPQRADYRPQPSKTKEWLSNSLPQFLHGSWLGSTNVPAPSPEETEDSLLKQFSGQIEIIPIRGARLAHIFVNSKDPKFAAEAANTLATVYIQNTQELNSSSKEKAAKWFTDQLDELRSKVELSKRSLYAFRAKHGLLQGQQGQVVAGQKLTELNTELLRAEMRKAETFSRFNEVQSVLRKRDEQGVVDWSNLDASAEVLASPLIQTLRAQEIRVSGQVAELSDKYGPLHPKMARAKAELQDLSERIRREVQKIYDSVKREYDVAVARERAIKEAVVRHNQEKVNLEQYEIEHGILEGETQSNQQLYDIFVKMAKEADVSSGIRPNNVYLADPAVSSVIPVKPRKTLNTMMGFLLGLMSGVALALVLEWRDRSLKGPEDLEHYLPHVSLLGMVPLMTNREVVNRGLHLPLATNRPSPLAESVRAIRTSLLLSSPDELPLSVLITSPGESEGKTTLAVSLGVAIAQLEHSRVILIDADLRKAAAHSIFDIQSNNGRPPGLADYLAGRVSREDIVYPTQIPNLSVIPRGERAPNPSELFHSKRMGELLQWYRQQGIQVIVDAPPVLAFTDSVLLATQVEGVLLVVSAGQTTREASRLAVQRLAGSGSKLLGVVMQKARSVDVPYYATYYKRR